MPVLFRIDAVRRTVYTTLHGDVTLADFVAYGNVLAAEPAFEPTFSELLDASAVQAVSAPASALREVSHASVFRAGSRRAVVAPSDFTYGLARMMQATYAGQATIAVFRDRESAREWLDQAGDAKPPAAG